MEAWFLKHLNPGATRTLQKFEQVETTREINELHFSKWISVVSYCWFLVDSCRLLLESASLLLAMVVIQWK